MTIQRSQLVKISTDPDIIRALEEALNGVLPGGAGLRFRVSLESVAGGSVATLNNSPVSGNPSKWARVNDAGVIRYLPLWS